MRWIKTPKQNVVKIEKDDRRWGCVTRGGEKNQPKTDKKLD